MLDAFAMHIDFLLGPEGAEAGALARQFLDQRLGFGRGARPRHVAANIGDHEARDALPVMQPVTAVRPEQEAQDVAVPLGKARIIGEHGDGGAVPGDDRPVRRLHHGGRIDHRLEHALQLRRDGRADRGFGARRPILRQEIEVLAFGVGQGEGAGEALDDIGRGRAAAPLLEPGVPGGADMGELGHFLTAQPRGAASLRRKAERRGIEPRAAVLQENAECLVSAIHGGAPFRRRADPAC